MGKYIMALDQGTTGSRCVLFDKFGKAVSIAKKEFRQIYPAPGWVEHDPVEIWESQLDVAKEAMAAADVSSEDIIAIGITNQRETTILWDKKTGEPVCNAIVWQCRRSAEIAEEVVKSGNSEIIREKTGLRPDAYFSATKIMWIFENIPGVKQRAQNGEIAFGTVDTWLMWNLTKGKSHLTDYTNASRTMMFNIESLKWDEELLDLFGICKEMLPRVKASQSVFTHTDASVFGCEIPICGVAGDQQSALFGQCCFEPGDVKNTYGTGCFVLMNAGDKKPDSKNGLITTLSAGCTKEKKEYVLEGSIFMGGALVQWMRDEMGFINETSETENISLSISDTGGVYIVPAFVGIGAPYWDQFAKGTITGITRGSGRKHFIRAALEAIAYQSFDVIRAMESDAGTSVCGLKADGGASANNFLMQFQSDILGADVVRTGCMESTALGAAFLAGLCSGFWKDKNELIALKNKKKVFRSSMDKGTVEKLINGWHDAVRKTLN